jgi:hypothetical protein
MGGERDLRLGGRGARSRSGDGRGRTPDLWPGERVPWGPNAAETAGFRGFLRGFRRSGGVSPPGLAGFRDTFGTEAVVRLSGARCPAGYVSTLWVLRKPSPGHLPPQRPILPGRHPRPRPSSVQPMKPVLTPRAPWFAYLAPALFAACLLSCEQPPPPLTEYPQGTARGTVFEDRNGNGVQDEGEPGIPGVGVSDQRLVTVTNSQGRWSLPRHDKAIYFVIKPRGYRTPLSEDNLPLFYYLHNETQPLELEGPTIPTTGPLPSSMDFPMVRQQEPERFQALFWSPPRERVQLD